MEKSIIERIRRIMEQTDYDICSDKYAKKSKECDCLYEKLKKELNDNLKNQFDELIFEFQRLIDLGFDDGYESGFKTAFKLFIETLS